MAVVMSKLHGVETELESKLKTMGIKDSEDLLKRCKMYLSTEKGTT